VAAGIRDIAYDRVNDTIHYVTFYTGNTLSTPATASEWRIWRANADGTGDSVIYGPISNAIGQIHVDKTNSKLWWTESNGTHPLIRRSDLDGTSPTTLYTGTGFSLGLTGIQWSRKLARVFWWEAITTGTTSAADGLFSNNFAFTDLKQELQENATSAGHNALGGSGIPQRIFLTRGLADTGSATTE
jgi:hypothetical protein